MTHGLVLAPGDQVELHWPQPGLPPTMHKVWLNTEAVQPDRREGVLTHPAAAAVHEAVHAAIVRLSPWTAHHRHCARVTAAGDCDCGLQAELLAHQWSI